MTLYAFQKLIGYTFKDESLLVLALTHSSWANEHAAGNAHNERLEFLGDAVLEIAVSARLFTLFTDAREGELTRLRSGLVNATTLATVARKLHLDEVLRMARGEENQGGRQRDALLSDAMEAVFGGVFLDGGMDEARAVIERLYEELWPVSATRIRRKDFKTKLQEATQRQSKGLPVYVLEDSQGPEHARIFSVRVDLPDGQSFRASGPGLKRAEQEAARVALAVLEEQESEA
ncbi:MAG: ribonuclease III [Bilophila sp.]